MSNMDISELRAAAAAEAVDTETVDISTIIAGDIITYYDAGEGECYTDLVAGIARADRAELWTAQPYTHVVLFESSIIARIHGNVDRLVGAAALQWHAGRQQEQTRAELADMLNGLASHVTAGLPLPSYDRMNLSYDLDTREQLEAVAKAYGVPAEFDSPSRSYLVLVVKHGRHEIEFYCSRPKETVPTEAVDELAAQIDADYEGRDIRHQNQGGAA